MPEHGTVYTARLLIRKDLDRQIVKSSNCTVKIPELELTIPPGKGQLTTVEGLLRDVVGDLEIGQPLRRIEAEEAYTKIKSILDALKAVIGDDESDENAEAEVAKKTTKQQDKDSPLSPKLSVLLDDPSGNSFIEFEGSTSDPKWNLRTYKRTRQQNVELGLVAPDEPQMAPNEAPSSDAKQVEGRDAAEEALTSNDGEIYAFPGFCSSCGAGIQTLMKKVNIPYFKVCALLYLVPDESRCSLIRRTCL